MKGVPPAALLLVGSAMLAGCATTGAATAPNAVCFDRAQFAFMLADVRVLVDQKCKRANADKVECARMNEQYEAVKRAVVTPPSAPAGNQIDAEQIMKLLGVLIGAAS